MASTVNVGTGGQASKTGFKSQPREILGHILAQLHNCSQTKPGQWQACCPVHKGGREADKSFGVHLRSDGAILLNCFAGCAKSAILAALGVTARDLAPERAGPGPDRTRTRSATPTAPTPKPAPPKEWGADVARWSKNFADWPKARQLLAADLGVPEWAFDALPIGAMRKRDVDNPDGHREGACWTFPERDGRDERYVGVMIRKVDASAKTRKKALGGANRGLTIPAGLKDRRGGRLFVVEGPSDTLAMWAGGARVVGRPGLDTGVREIAVYARIHDIREIVWIVENDGLKKMAESRAAARRLAAELPYATVRTATPPDGAKDPREWLAARVGPTSTREEWTEAVDELKRRLLAGAELVPPADTISTGSATRLRKKA
jgi:hypothetical protein